MERERVKIELAVDLDPIPGTFHTKESAEDSIQAILLSSIPHYNPIVFKD